MGSAEAMRQSAGYPPRVPLPKRLNLFLVEKSAAHTKWPSQSRVRGQQNSVSMQRTVAEVSCADLQTDLTRSSQEDLITLLSEIPKEIFVSDM